MSEIIETKWISAGAGAREEWGVTANEHSVFFFFSQRHCSKSVGFLYRVMTVFWNSGRLGMVAYTYNLGTVGG